jgi:hypothetical protein
MYLLQSNTELTFYINLMLFHFAADALSEGNKYFIGMGCWLLIKLEQTSSYGFQVPLLLERQWSFSASQMCMI